jgi:hypothetical protein
VYMRAHAHVCGSSQVTPVVAAAVRAAYGAPNTGGTTPRLQHIQINGALATVANERRTSNAGECMPRLQHRRINAALPTSSQWCESALDTGATTNAWHAHLSQLVQFGARS